MKLSFVILVSLLVLSAASLALATTDPELKQCRHQCKVQRQFGEDEKRECLDRCQDYYREKEWRERGRGQEEEEWSSDPEKRLSQCQKQCERQQGEQRSLCRHRCQQRYEREPGREEDPGRREREEDRRREKQEDEYNEAKEEKNPYVFEEEHFTSRVKSEHGRVSVLQRFTKRSDLLRGIENYRLAFLEANPQTFIAPTHLDADAVFFVARGQGTITTINEDKRERYNIEQGDVIRVRAGHPIYLINNHESEKLQVVKFINPVNIPGKYEGFRAAGGGQEESFYEAFSWELLEAALKTDRRSIEQVLKQKQEVIVKASREQIRALSGRDHEEVGGKIWPFGDQSRWAPFNLLRKHQIQSNNYGQLFEATPNEHKEQLKDLDMAIAFSNITKGAMEGPLYDGRSTKVAVVVDGEGYFEMACPHVTRGSHGQKRSSETYTKISSRLRRGTVFIVPAGHPVAVVASPNSNLQVVCFKVNAQGNKRFTLAGKNNVVSLWEREAKELAFGAQAREVEEVFGSQNEEFFYPGPRRQQRDGRADA